MKHEIFSRHKNGGLLPIKNEIPLDLPKGLLINLFYKEKIKEQLWEGIISQFSEKRKKKERGVRGGERGRKEEKREVKRERKIYADICKDHYAKIF